MGYSLPSTGERQILNHQPYVSLREGMDLKSLASLRHRIFRFASRDATSMGWEKTTLDDVSPRDLGLCKGPDS